MSSTKSSSSSSSSASASSAGGDPSALSPALKYFLTLLRGELVLIEQCDGTIHEGLFHTLETNETTASGTAATGMALVLRMAQKQSNQHSSKKAELPTFETERNATNPFIGVLKIPLTNIVQLFASDLSLAQWTMAYADWMSKNGSNKSASHHQRTGGAGQAFATDSQISGASDRERELVRWAGDDDGTTDVGGLETSASLGEFNQFETFERMTGKTSTFKFDDYSTPLDRSSAFYKSNEARAAALASQILSSEAGSIHQKLEREGDECSTLRDRDADEGDLFSDVRREPTTGTAASAASSTASTGKYKPGAFAKAKKEKEAALAAAAAAASTTSPSAAKTPGVTSPTKEAVASNAAVKSPPPSATKSSEPTTTAAAAGNSSSPKPVEISLAAQQKVAEAASSTPAKDSTTEAAAATPATSATEASASEAKDTKADATATDGAKSTSEQPAKPKSTLNPKAPSFKLSASAREFTPSFAATPAATAAAPAAPLLNTVAPVHGVGQQPFMASPPVGQMFMPNVPLMPGVGMAPPFPPQMNIPQMMNLNLGGNVGLGGVRGVPPSMLGQAPGGGFFLPPQQQQQAQAAAAAQQQAAFLMQQMMFNPQFAAAAAHNMRQQQQQPTPNQFAQLFQQQQQFQQQLAQAQIQQQFQQQQQQQQQQAVQAQQIQRQTSGNASTTTPVAGSPQAAQQQQQQQQFRPQQF